MSAPCRDDKERFFHHRLAVIRKKIFQTVSFRRSEVCCCSKERTLIPFGVTVLCLFLKKVDTTAAIKIFRVLYVINVLITLIQYMY